MIECAPTPYERRQAFNSLGDSTSRPPAPRRRSTYPSRQMPGSHGLRVQPGSYWEAPAVRHDILAFFGEYSPFWMRESDLSHHADASKRCKERRLANRNSQHRCRQAKWAAADLVSEVGERSHDSRVTPRRVLSRHADNELVNLDICLGTSGLASTARRVTFLRDEPAVPGKNRLGSRSSTAFSPK